MQCASHTEEVIDLPCRVCVHGKWASCFLNIHRYEVGLTATNDDDFCGWGEGGEGVGGDGGSEGTEVVLAILWVVVSIVYSREELVIGGHTPQKKCRIKMTRTRRGPFSLSAYKLLKVYFFPSLSSTGRSATFSRSPLVGGLLLTLISPLKSAEGSFTAILLKEESGLLPIVSSQRTRGTRVRVSSITMILGLESNKEREETKDRIKEEAHVVADPPETTDSISKCGG